MRCADAGQQFDPAGGVPRADQFSAPALILRSAHVRTTDQASAPKRIAVEIDDALRQIEHRARAPEEIVAHCRNFG